MKYAQIELPDDFEKGQCLDCPFSYVTDAEVYCVFHNPYYDCKIEITESEESNEQTQSEEAYETAGT